MIDDIQPQRKSADPPDQPVVESVALPRPAFANMPTEVIKPGDTPNLSDAAKATHSTSKGKGPKAWWNKFKHLPRKQKIIIGVVAAVVLVAIAGAVWWFFIREKPAPPPAPAVVTEEPAPEPPKPTTVASPLTGVQVDPEAAKLPTTGVMIENSPDARPQSGLYDAGVVFEAIAEGGITRFLALYQEAKPGYIGPVRSVRPYYLDFVVPFDAPITHAGGSGQALAEIKQQGIKDIDHGANPNAFERVSNRYAPHNLYTSRDKLLAVHTAKGWTTSTFTGFTRKTESASQTPNAKSIDFTISGFLYNPHFDYEPPTNSYVRAEGGKFHMDEKAGKAISPKVVVALVMSHNYQGIYSVYGTTGSGKAYFFQDGTVVEGTWAKTDRKGQFTFKDAAGAALALNPGQTWISIVSSPGAVTYKP